MEIIDLTLPLYSGMPVYPGDPEASIEVIRTLEGDGWNMKRIEINSHDGTHVNAQSHAVANGKTLDAYPLRNFCGPAVIYNPSVPISPDHGIIFRDRNVTRETAEEIKRVRPPFVGLSNNFEFDVDIERELLKEDIILYERLYNLDSLPNSFEFFGMPLRIKEGDGSPVRAIAITNKKT